jgi:hypothetical protein
MGSNIYTDLPEGWKLNVWIGLDDGPHFRLVGAIKRHSSFGISVVAPGQAQAYGTQLASGLVDTSEMNSDQRLAKLIPLVEAPFAALLAAAPIAAARVADDAANKAQAKASRQTQQQSDASASLARFEK